MINDIQTPKNCKACKFQYVIGFKYYACTLKGSALIPVKVGDVGKPDWCPFVEEKESEEV